MSIGKHFTCEVITIDKNQGLKAAAELMFDKNTGSVVVTDGESPVGMVTDRDLANCYLQGTDISQAKVTDAMSSELVTIKNSQGIQDALSAMAEKGVRRAPIVDEQDRLVGIATTDDIVKLLADELHALSQIIHQQDAVTH
jgi:CBS domain-containing protein